ncbi:WD40 repeat-like protein [Ramaria rubella]|nr:WD40 repeat-like protein [Ramaria rubella]
MSTTSLPQSPSTSDPHAPQPFVKEGSDWTAHFRTSDPERKLDINLLHTLVHDSVVCCVRFSPDGTYLATGSNHNAQVYSVSTGEKIWTLPHVTLTPPHANAPTEDLYVRCLCFSPDGEYLATGAEDGVVRIWNTHTHTLISTLIGHIGEIYTTNFSPNGRWLVSGSNDATVRVWPVVSATGQSLFPQTEVVVLSDERDENVADTPNENGAISSLAISPSSRFIATGAIDNQNLIRIWDLGSGRIVARLAGHTDSVYSMVFTQDGTQLVSGGLDKSVRYWNVSALGLLPVVNGVDRGEGAGEVQCVCVWTDTGFDDYVLSVALSHGVGALQWVIAASKDRCVRFRMLPDECEVTVKGHHNSVISVDASPVGGIFATGSGDWGALIWSYTRLR